MRHTTPPLQFIYNANKETLASYSVKRGIELENLMDTIGKLVPRHFVKINSQEQSSSITLVFRLLMFEGLDTNEEDDYIIRLLKVHTTKDNLVIQVFIPDQHSFNKGYQNGLKHLFEGDLIRQHIQPLTNTNISNLSDIFIQTLIDNYIQY